MDDNLSTSNNNIDQEFPASSPSLINKIPKSVLWVVFITLALIFAVTTFPQKRSKKVKKIAAQVSEIDAFEEQSPVKKDPFSTAMQSGNMSTPMVRNVLMEGSDDQNYIPQSSDYYQQTPSMQKSSNESHDDNSSYDNYQQPSPKPYLPSSEISQRLDNSYQTMVQHFKNTAQQAVVAVREDEYKQLLSGDKLNKIEPALQNLTENSNRLSNTVNFSVPSGTRIRAFTMQEVNSDHPGYFTARVTSPSELAGFMLLCQGKTNLRDRIPVTANKIISPDGSKETEIPGEIQMKYAGLEGDIKTHVGRRLIPPIMNALVGAGAGYLYYRAIAVNQQPDSLGQRINTSDAVAGPPYQAGIQGVQNEISRFGGDYPNTVIVPEGTEFELLVTESFTLQI